MHVYKKCMMTGCIELSYTVHVNFAACSMDDPRFYNASVFFLKHGEHTWGLSSVFDSHHWSNDDFYPIMSNLCKSDHFIVRLERIASL